MLYFLFACLKNFLLGMVLVWVIYAAMTRYFIGFTLALKAWAPGDGQLASARLEEGKVELAAASCDIGADVRDVVAGYEVVARNQVIVTDVDDLPGTIVADAKLLRQVFPNLLSNAIKYSPEGTTITVRGWRTAGGERRRPVGRHPQRRG